MVDGLILSNKTVLINGAKWVFKTHKQASAFYWSIINSLKKSKKEGK